MCSLNPYDGEKDGNAKSFFSFVHFFLFWHIYIILSYNMHIMDYTTAQFSRMRTCVYAPTLNVTWEGFQQTICIECVYLYII